MDCARSALERKSSVGATLLYGVRRLGAAFGKLTTNRPAYAQGYGAASTNRHQFGEDHRERGGQREFPRLRRFKIRKTGTQKSRKGISEIEGKAVRAAASQSGRGASFTTFY